MKDKIILGIALLVLSFVMFFFFNSYIDKGVRNMSKESERKTTRLNKKEAVLLAEDFIRINGYTDQKIDPDSKLTNESFEFYDNNKDKLKTRFATLKPKAVGAKFDQEKRIWIVGFEYVKERSFQAGDETGRAVVMDADGKNIQVQHQDVILNSIKQ